MEILGGWQIDKDLGMNRISIRITNPETKVSVVKYCLFDTGFFGYLGLDEETILLLNLSRSGHGKGLTVKGMIDYENYKSMVEIIGTEQETLVKIKNINENDDDDIKDIIIIQKFNFPIIGIKAIRQFSWLILSERDAIFLIKQ